MHKTLQILLSILLLAILIGIGFFMMRLSPVKDLQEVKQESKDYSKKIMNTEKTKVTTAILKTNMGDIKIEFFDDKTPNTVANFTKLASEGFYNGVRFHRVIKDFMIQSGDPLSKDVANKPYWGTGGPRYKFADEFVNDLSNVSGTISMANSGPNTNGSQFFINANNNSFLDGKHTVFGKVVEGMDVVQKIENTATGPNDVPVEDVIINTVELN
jgi:peptidylprolyl isomerase/peptidyl-prolyl cis-trans isomerase A (cyclophilin A)